MTSSALTIVNGLVRRALLRTSCIGLIFRKESGARYFTGPRSACHSYPPNLYSNVNEYNTNSLGSQGKRYFEEILTSNIRQYYLVLI